MAFLPATPSLVPARLRRMLFPEDHLSLFAGAFSLACQALIYAALRSLDARRFFAVGVTLQIVALAVTVRKPELHHLGLLFAMLLIALIIDAYSPVRARMRFKLPSGVGAAVIVCVLAVQAAAGLYGSVSALRHPYSDAKEVGAWLKQQGLDKNPLVLDGYYPEAVLGYVERSSAYVTSCRCFGSYAVWNTGYQFERSASPEDLRTARGGSGLPVILIHADEKLPQETVEQLGLVQLHSFGQPEMRTHGSYTIYEQVAVEGINPR
jgi:hypothetical protein